MQARPRLKRLIKTRAAPLAAVLCTVAEPSFVEACGLAGFDCLILDLEHSAISDGEFVAAVRAADSVGLPVLARLPIDELHRIGHLLDGGGDGVVVAQITAPAEVDAAAAATHFPPLGRRGAGPARTNAQGAADTAAWVGDENDGVFFGVLLESRDAVAAADAIISHPEVDGILVGTRDLSVDLGVPGQLDHPDVAGAVARARDLCTLHEKVFGSMVRDLSQPGSASDGLRLIGLGTALRPAVELLHERKADRA
jgi:4-hydroxy-2-oxoheptanedioate aldolase